MERWEGKKRKEVKILHFLCCIKTVVLNAILVTKMQLPVSKTPNGCKLTRQFSEVVLFRKSVKPIGRLC